MGDSDDTSPPPANGRNRLFSGVVAKVVVPVVIGVLVAFILALITPLGDNLREVFFPTSAKVTGSVMFAGHPAAGAQLILDGGHREIADEDGYFEIGGVGNGRHTLEARVGGANPTKVRFRVERRMTDLKLDPIRLDPVAVPVYVVKTGTPQFSDYVDYDLTVWLVGSGNGLNQVASVSYEMPPPLTGSQPVTVRARQRQFCYRQTGKVTFESSGQFGLLVATVRLHGGKSYRLTVPATPLAFSIKVPACLQWIGARRMRNRR